MTALVVIDDHPVYREGLAAAITAGGRWTLGTYESVEEFLDHAQQADVVLLEPLLNPGRFIPGSAALRSPPFTARRF